MWLLDNIPKIYLCICLVAQLYKEIMDTETNTQRFFVL